MRQFEKFFKRFVTFAEKANPTAQQVGTACAGVEQCRPSGPTVVT
jgi:hypothetical protein